MKGAVAFHPVDGCRIECYGSSKNSETKNVTNKNLRESAP